MHNILFHCTPGEENYLKLLKPILAGKANVALTNTVPDVSWVQIAMTAKEKNCTRIASTSEKFLKLVVDDKSAKLDFYAGSLIDKGGYEILFLDPVEHLLTVPYGKFLYERFLSKFLRPTDWMQIPEFKWQLFEPSQADALLDLFATASLIAIDIETADEPECSITCVGYSAVHIDVRSSQFTVTTVVVPYTDTYCLAFSRKLSGLPVPKVFQNGKYDNSHLLRYNCPTTNWAFDTINLFHSWYSELPKDLGFITACMLRKAKYWKDLKHTTDLQQYYEYNARDAFNTAMSCLALLMEMPDWAINNFLMEMPVVIPSLLAEVTGMLGDVQAVKKLEGQLQSLYEGEREKIQTMVANKNFNPGSWQQLQKLWVVLGSGDITSTDKIAMDKIASRNPLNARLIYAIKTYKENKRLDSTYVDESKLWHRRWFWAQNPHGTDTGRNASRESQYSTRSIKRGLQIHNIPRDKRDPRDKSPIRIKDQFVADPGFYLGEADMEQNEARGTAYLSGDKALITTVEGTRDFHGVNASLFFGVPYEEIIGPNGEKLNVELRDDIGKRINHGANYNMGPQVLLDTMGVANVLKAKKLLKLPAYWGLLDVAAHLLQLFDNTYKVVRDKQNGWYAKCINDVVGSHFLIGPTGWHRYCFGDPRKNKHWLNAYVAHPPQSLAAMLLNAAYVLVFSNVWLLNQNDFKLGPQIHDSIVFQYRIGYEHLAWEVKKCLEMRTQVTDTFGITRTLFVPVALKGSGERWSELKSLKKRVY